MLHSHFILDEIAPMYNNSFILFIRHGIPTTMRHWISRLFLALLFTLAPLLAADAATTEGIRGKVVVYNYHNTSNNINYGYYSYVIPDSISIELRKSPQYNVQSVPVAMEYVDSKAPEDVYKNHVAMLADRGKEFDADFVITGSYTIEQKNIIIKTQIFDVRDQRIKDIHETSEELGALLMVIIDQLSAKINTELQKGLAQKKLRVSPFIRVHSALSGISFGLLYGIANTYDDWHSAYKKPFVTTFYLSYGLSNIRALSNIMIVRNLGLAGQYDYFGDRYELRDTDQTSYIYVKGYSGNLSFSYNLASFFQVELLAGFGQAFSKVELISDPETGGMPTRLASRKSTDPYLNIMFGAHFLYNRLKISGAVAYKRIFFSDTPMDLTVIYFGLGYTI